MSLKTHGPSVLLSLACGEVFPRLKMASAGPGNTSSRNGRQKPDNGKGAASLPSVSLWERGDCSRHSLRCCSTLLPELGHRPICQPFSGKGSGMTGQDHLTLGMGPLSPWCIWSPVTHTKVDSLSKDTRAQGTWHRWVDGQPTGWLH